jgi:translation elongation factor EF-4
MYIYLPTQAQTLATHEKAQNLGLKIIPIVTKVDLPGALVDETALAMSAAFDFCPSEVIMTRYVRLHGDNH